MQGRILGVALERLGHSVIYYDFAYRKHLSDCKDMLGIMLHQGRDETIKHLKSLKAFHYLRKQITITKKIKDIDCVILGSDTIWDISRKHIQKNSDVLWGNVFDKVKIITYAGSIGNTPKELLKHKKNIENTVSKWAAISVRDSNTKDAISQFTNAKIFTVCDPTLLLKKKDYEQMIGDPIDSDYIFLYLFKDLSYEQSEELKAFAKNKKMKIIRGVNGVTNKAADFSVENSPLLFLQHMLAAKYVITDTFHGTIFSINLNKQFVAIDRGKNKVNDAIRFFRFEDRLITNDLPFVETLTFPIAYEERMASVDMIRDASWSYLETSI